MARYSEAGPILEAARAWKEKCLLADGSIFSEEHLWTLENFRYLDRFYVQNLEYGSGNFWSKLKAQLSAAPPEAKKLAAELFWVFYLIVSKGFITARTKRFQIKKVWEWSGDSLPENPELLGDLLAAGVANPGTAYNTHRWRELRFFITLMNDWKSLDAKARSDLLSDPWRFAEWLEKREFAEGRQFRHVLLFLLFPDSFERIATASHKREIVRAFRQEWAEDPDDFEYGDRVALDREVLRIRERLEGTYGERGEVDFYQPAVQEHWHQGATPSQDGDPGDGSSRLPSESASRDWYAEHFAEARTWLLSAGPGGRMWDDFTQKEIIAIGWDQLGDLSEYPSREAVGQALNEATGKENPTNDSLACWQFAHEMNVGDVIIAKQGRSKLLGWGRLTGDYLYEPERGEYKSVRPIQWEEEGRWSIPKNLWITNKTLTDFTDHPSWIRWALDRMEGQHGSEPGSEPHEEYSMDRALDGLFIDAEDFARILDTLSRRKNIILQGPPGVGKTFIARRIAWRLIGREDPTCLQIIQFHQSYAYEDFIQGWRPTEGGGFELKPGVFYQFCKQAETRPDDPHVFIIDEINRGNLSRILGELMMLIEADKRGDEFAIPLTYSPAGEDFFVPANVYVLGLMNTADRSLALVDYALRRRFGFVTLEPAFGEERFEEYLLEAEVEESVVKWIEERMQALNAAIREDRKNLGPGFQIGHSYFVPSGDEESLDEAWCQEIVETQIVPLLEEYWFDQTDKLAKHRGELFQ